MPHVEAMAPAAFADVQSLVLRGSAHGHVGHCLVHCPDGAAATAFLLAVLNAPVAQALAVGRAAPDPDVAQLAIGLSFRGLQRLHVPEPVLGFLRWRAPAFTAGAASRAATRLGDAGESAAQHWRWPIAPPALHMVLTVHARCDRALEEEIGKLLVLSRQHGLTLKKLPRGEWLGAPSDKQKKWVHFGYRDGLSGPRVRGWHPEPIGCEGGGKSAVREHAAGEFLLGHPQDSGANPWQLSQAPERVRAFFRNASFGVLRQIHQDEAAFQAFLAEAARQLAARAQLDHTQNTLAQLRLFVQAKIMGRWPSGHWLSPAARPMDPAPCHPVEDDHTLHYAGDAQGLGCPFGAHIRRMNPREGAGAPVPDADEVQMLAHNQRQRVLLRRGMPYGPVYNDQDKSSPAQERGLLGLFFCASLEEQFEHITGQWGAGIALGSQDTGTAHDPFVAQQPSQGRLEIPLAGHQAPLVLHPPSCVSTRGTAYLLYPSRPALLQLAKSTPWRESRWDEP